MSKRNYKNYSEEDLKKCLQDIKKGKLSQREAEKHYGIARSTIKNKLKGSHPKAVGKPVTFSAEEETLIANRLKLCCDFGLPLGFTDIKQIVKYYPDKTDKVIPHFKEGKYPRCH